MFLLVIDNVPKVEIIFKIDKIIQRILRKF